MELNVGLGLGFDPFEFLFTFEPFVILLVDFKLLDREGRLPPFVG